MTSDRAVLLEQDSHYLGRATKAQAVSGLALDFQPQGRPHMMPAVMEDLGAKPFGEGCFVQMEPEEEELAEVGLALVGPALLRPGLEGSAAEEPGLEGAALMGLAPEDSAAEGWVHSAEAAAW